MKQTALEFLLQELWIEKLIAKEKLTMAAEVIRQAKQMEKEQIMQAYNDGKTAAIKNLGEFTLWANSGWGFCKETSMWRSRFVTPTKWMLTTPELVDLFFIYQKIDEKK